MAGEITRRFESLRDQARLIHAHLNIAYWTDPYLNEQELAELERGAAQFMGLLREMQARAETREYRASLEPVHEPPYWEQG